jgi:hypothetical protein
MASGTDHVKRVLRSEGMIRRVRQLRNKQKSSHLLLGDQRQTRYFIWISGLSMVTLALNDPRQGSHIPKSIGPGLMQAFRVGFVCPDRQAVRLMLARAKGKFASQEID